MASAQYWPELPDQEIVAVSETLAQMLGTKREQLDEQALGVAKLIALSNLKHKLVREKIMRQEARRREIQARERRRQLGWTLILIILAVTVILAVFGWRDSALAVALSTFSAILGVAEHRARKGSETSSGMLSRARLSLDREDTQSPPAGLEFVLWLFLRGKHRDDIIGDLAEQFEKCQARIGRGKASVWYAKEVGHAVLPSLVQLAKRLAWLSPALGWAWRHRDEIIQMLPH